MMVIIVIMMVIIMVIVFHNGDYDGYESCCYDDGGHDCKTGVGVYDER